MDFKYVDQYPSSWYGSQVDSWLSPDGELFPVESANQPDFAYRCAGVSAQQLEYSGWLRILNGEIVNHKTAPTHGQTAMLRDMMYQNTQSKLGQCIRAYLDDHEDSSGGLDDHPF